MSSDTTNVKTQRLFRFAVFQGDKLLCEVSESADKFNPSVRNSVKIRNDIHNILSRLNRVMTMKSYNTTYSLGKDAKVLNFSKIATTEVEKYDNKVLRYTFNNTDLFDGTSTLQGNFKSVLKPKTKVNPYNSDNVGVECKFGLYINNNPIVERNFYVENYNPEVMYSTDLIDVCDTILYDICDRLRKEDINYAWENKDLNEKMGFSFPQIFELKPEERATYIRQLYK